MMLLTAALGVTFVVFAVLSARIVTRSRDVAVPAFVEIGDKIEIDTRTGEYKSRVKG